MLPRGEVHVWLLDPAALAAAPDGAAGVSVLTPEEQARASRFVFAADRDAFVAARVLARVVLASYAGAAPRDLSFDANEYGKLHLAAPETARGLQFNISHTRALVACAVARDRAVGVDVEELRDPPLDLVDRYFAPPEAAALRALPPGDQREAFFALWTLKEAFIKALGLGLSMPLDRFALRWSPPALLPYGDFATAAADWQFVQGSPTDTCRLALCVSTPDGATPTVHLRWMTPDEVVRASRPV